MINGSALYPPSPSRLRSLSARTAVQFWRRFTNQMTYHPVGLAAANHSLLREPSYYALSRQDTARGRAVRRPCVGEVRAVVTLGLAELMSKSLTRSPRRLPVSPFGPMADHGASGSDTDQDLVGGSGVAAQPGRGHRVEAGPGR
jgi:hypothetical protein